MQVDWAITLFVGLKHDHSICVCFISVIYTPSQDPLPYVYDPPPAYDTVASIILSPLNPGGGEGATGDDSDGEKNPPIMVLPPNYDDAAKPIPAYQDAILS